MSVQDIGTSPPEISTETQKGLERSGAARATGALRLNRNAEHTHLIRQAANRRDDAWFKQNETRLKAGAVQTSQQLHQLPFSSPRLQGPNKVSDGDRTIHCSVLAVRRDFISEGMPQAGRKTTPREVVPSNPTAT